MSPSDRRRLGRGRWMILCIASCFALNLSHFEVSAFSSYPAVGRRAPQFGQKLDTSIRRRYQRTHSPRFASIDSLEGSDERRNGLLVLVTVPLAWGTYEPAVRLAYQVQPDIPPFVFSFLYYLAAATSLCFLALRPQKSAVDSESSLIIRGGIELGTYLFVGNGFQVVGLKTVPSDRAAFLLQLTTIFVPLAQAALAGDLRAVPRITWTACFLALCGVACIGLDGDGGMTLGFSQGDVLIILAAAAYTCHCLRLETFAKRVPAVSLAAAKATTETLWSLATVLLCLGAAKAASMDLPMLDVMKNSGENIASFLTTAQADSSDRLTLAGTILWTGLVPVAYTIGAQSYGQARVSPATANLIYTIQPVVTAIIAWFLLGESLGPAGLVGGGLIGAAVLLVIQGDNEQTEERKTRDELA